MKRRSRNRRLPRYKRTGIVIAATGLATGLLAVVLWPRVKQLLIQPTITAGEPTITQRAATVAALLED